MSQTNSDALDVITQVVVDTIDKKLDDANFDKSQVGTVVAVNGSDYTIAVFGSQYTITSDQVFTIGQSVVVTALQGDMKRLVCSPDNVGTMKTVDSKVNVIGDNGISTRLSTAESSIKQNATNITSKVSATDYTGKKIASMINQQADNVSISAKKINLKGAVTTDSISTKGLDASVIKAGKITTDHLDLTGDLTIGEDGHVKIGDNVIDANMLKPDTISEKLWQLIDHVDSGNRKWAENYEFPSQLIELSNVSLLHTMES